ncbi:hypothetical protein ACJ72_03433 [Emergomyces africanus]|uniref:DUF7587 domain-containing protein n=1 Tax=Emergomyces africanus TaxID=1955775 RepID=A0A1B7NZK8_9EURO|nr:hypothetical protein ACJ72_03433 [Emergomyces africanus]
MSQLQIPSQSDEESLSFLDFGKIHSPRHKWTGPQREVLCVLRRFYAYTKKEEAAIFNYLFETEIEGFKNGLPISTVHTQWHHLTWSKHPIWISVNATSPFNDEYKECCHIIELASTVLDISVCRRACDDGHPTYPGFQLLQSFFRPSPEADLRYNQTSDTNVEPDNDTEARVSKPEMDIEPRRECGAEFEKPRMKSRYGSQQKPQILYRFFNSESGGINNPQYFASGMVCTLHPSLYNQCDIEMMAKTHLSRFKVNSPFISTSAALLSCVHKMLTKNQNAYVSIIDVSKLDQSMIFSAEDILGNNPLSSDITRGYFGWSEWLIWREIPEPSVVCTIAESKFLEIAKLHSDIGSVLQVADIKSFTYNRRPLHSLLRNSPTKLDKPTGAIVGKFLKLINLPMEYIEQVATKISHGWRFTRTRFPRYEEFFEGVRVGYAYSTAPTLDHTIAYETPPITPEKSVQKAEVIVIDDDTDVEAEHVYEQEVVVIEDEEEHMEIVVVEDEDEELEEVKIVAAVGPEEAANYEIAMQSNSHEQVTMDRFQIEFRRTIESGSDIVDEITPTPTPQSTYQWQSVQIEMGGTGNETVVSIFERDRERVNRMMGW